MNHFLPAGLLQAILSVLALGAFLFVLYLTETIDKGRP
jgi:hypothetical protein